MRKVNEVRKKGLLVLAVCAALLAAGCGKKADVTGTTTTAATETETTGSQAETQGETQAEAMPEVTTTPEDMKKLVGDQVTLGQYTGVEYTRQDTEVTDEEIESQISQLLSQNPVVEEITDRAVENGDIVNIDFVGKKDGVAFDGGTAEDYELEIGSNSFIEGFEAGLVGAKTGDSLDLDLTFPENYNNADLAGKPVVFTVTVNSIKKETPAETFDDAFVARVTKEYKTADEYKTAIAEQLKEQKVQNALNQQKGEVLNKVVGASEFKTLPQDRVDYQAYYNKYSQQYQASMFGMTLEDLLGMYGTTMDQFEQQCLENAQEYVKQDMVMYAIADKENIEVTEEDLNQIAKDYDFETPEAMYGTYKEADVYEAVLFDNVMEFLLANAKEVEAAPAE